MKIDEIVTSLRACASIGWSGCSFCQREELAAEEVGCADALKLLAADLIENQQREIEALWQANRALPEAPEVG